MSRLYVGTIKAKTEDGRTFVAEELDIRFRLEVRENFSSINQYLEHIRSLLKGDPSNTDLEAVALYARLLRHLRDEAPKEDFLEIEVRLY